MAHAATVPSRAYRYPHEEASGFKAWMIHEGQVEGTPIEAIGLVEAIARGDERAVARMHELGAAGPPYPPDLVIAVAQIQEEPEATNVVTNGTQTLQEALAAMGLN